MNNDKTNTIHELLDAFKNSKNDYQNYKNDEDVQFWQNLEPIGREFGSVDYEDE